VEQGAPAGSAVRREATAQRRDERAGLRFGWAVALLVLALMTAVAWSAWRGDMFVYQSRVEVQQGGKYVALIRADRQSALDLVRAERGWQMVAASFALVPLWFVAWRRFRIAGGRWIGIAWSLSAGAAVIALVAQRPLVPGMEGHGYCPSVVAGAVLLAAAFVVAPATRDPEEMSELQVKSLLRKHE
jgi:hypothetical protein